MNEEQVEQYLLNGENGMDFETGAARPGGAIPPGAVAPGNNLMNAIQNGIAEMGRAQADQNANRDANPEAGQMVRLVSESESSDDEDPEPDHRSLAPDATMSRKFIESIVV